MEVKFYVVVTTMRCGGNHDQSLFERGFMIKKYYKQFTMDFHPESDRLCSLRAQGKIVKYNNI